MTRRDMFKGRRLRPIPKTGLVFTLDGEPIGRQQAQELAYAAASYADWYAALQDWARVVKQACGPDGCPLEGIGLLRARAVEP